MQKQIPRAIRTKPQTAGTTDFSFLIVCTANGLRLHFPTITTRGAGYVAEAQKMAQLRYKTYVRKTQEDWTE